MAKNALQKKKRVAHFQNAFDNFSPDGGECYDYVSSIIQNMDSNFNTAHKSYIKDHAGRKAANRNKRSKGSNSPSTSGGKNSPEKSNYSNSKKFSMSRKFPLMEKSQKILKQLKHNRKIPKPRAHLACSVKSPAKAGTGSAATKQHVNSIKKKEAGKLKNSSVSNPALNKKNESKTCSNEKFRKRIGKKQFEQSGISESAKPSGCSKKNDATKTQGFCDVDKLQNSENETTDSEYERFVNKSKKGLKRKVNKKKNGSQYKSSKKSNRKSKRKKRASKQSDEEDSDFDNCDNGSVSNTSPCKKQKVVHETASNVYTSEPEGIADDFCNRDSSSESDVETSTSFGAQRVDLKTPFSALRVADPVEKTEIGYSRNISETSVNSNMTQINSCKKESTKSLASVVDSYNAATINTDVNNITETFAPCNMPLNRDSTHELPSCVNHLPISCKKESSESSALCIDLCDSDDDSTNVAHVNLPVTSMTKGNKDPVTSRDFSTAFETVDNKDSLVNGPIIKALGICGKEDLVTDGQISTRSVTVGSKDSVAVNAKSANLPVLFFSEVEKNASNNSDQNLIDSHSDENDIEIIDIVPIQPKRVVDRVTLPGLSQNVANNRETLSAVTIDNTLGSHKICPQTMIQKEQSRSVAQFRQTKSDHRDDVKHDAVFKTDICSELSQDKLIKKLPNVNSKEFLSQSSSSVLSFSNSSNKVVKAEKDLDDEIVILDSFGNTCSQTVVQKEQSKNITRITQVKSDQRDDATFVTDICGELSHDKQVKILSNINNKEFPGQSSSNVSICSNSSNNIVKNEKDSDDEIVILDSFAKFPENMSPSVKIKNDCQNNLTDKVKGTYSGLKMDNENQLHNLGTSNIKKELSLVSLSSLKGENQIESTSSKMTSVPLIKCGQLSSIISNSQAQVKNLSSKQKFAELEDMNVNHLLELFKKEFQTYQEIVQAEESVEASLKLLETNQAEKLKYIRTLVLKHLKNRENSINTGFGIEKELKLNASTVSNPLNLMSADLKNETESFTSKNTPESTIMQNKTVPNIDATGSLDIISDAKPNVSLPSGFELNPTIKLKLEAEATPRAQTSSVLPSPSHSGQKQVLTLSKQICNVCGREAIAACQRCAKVFFCSHECGKKFWNDGHINECG